MMNALCLQKAEQPEIMHTICGMQQQKIWRSEQEARQ
jgi:hypothetical protein